MNEALRLHYLLLQPAQLEEELRNGILDRFTLAIILGCDG